MHRLARTLLVALHNTSSSASTYAPPKFWGLVKRTQWAQSAMHTTAALQVPWQWVSHRTCRRLFIWRTSHRCITHAERMQQALAWALDPGTMALPFETIRRGLAEPPLIYTQEVSADCPAVHPPEGGISGLYLYGSVVVGDRNQDWLSGTAEADPISVRTNRPSFGPTFGVRMFRAMEADLASMEHDHAIQREGN